MRVITKQELEQILANHKKWLETRYTDKTEGERANLCEASLCGADLRGADLCGADLCEANLRGANLCEADLCGADLCGAILCGAILCEANLCEANLCEANLRGANLCEASLCGADLRGAVNIGSKQADFRGCDLDFGSIQLSCRGLEWKIDRRLAVQLLYHFCSHDCNDPEITKIQNSLLGVANQFHRVEECGALEEKEIPEAK